MRVESFQEEIPQTVTLTLKPAAEQRTLGVFQPGQFNMLYLFGIGEVPISISGDPAKTESIVHTIRIVGAVTSGLAKLRAGDVLGVRGPFGSSWPMEVAKNSDVVIVTGGIGLAPLRPVLYHIRNHRKDYGRVALLYGARTPQDRLYANELQEWKNDFQVLETVDRSDSSWRGSIGLVTTLFARAEFDAQRTIGMMCGPEVMMRAVVREFEKRGVGEDRLYLSLERNMQCAVGFCGHCQFGPSFVCMDGPVFRYDKIKTFFNIREA